MRNKAFLTLIGITPAVGVETARSRRLLWIPLLAAPLLVSSLILDGCNSSSTSSAPPPVTPPAISDIVTYGPISGFGSVIANGVVFETPSTIVTMDDQPASLSDLQIGMVVSIRGTVDTAAGVAEADEINFLDDVEGPITSIDPGDGSLVVLGRTVLIDELTVFDNATADTMDVGNIVQISGQRRSQERIQAMHIARIANAYSTGMEMEVKGEIHGLDVGMQRFQIGTQRCDYSAAMLELGDAELANGLYVEVSSHSPLSNGDLVLDRISARDRDRDRDRDQQCDVDCVFELEGYVTIFVSPTEFEVDGLSASTTDDTVYVNGTVDTLALDVKVAVDGTLDAAGVLIADRIVFRLPSLVEIKADIETIDAGNAAITVLGIAVVTNESTMLRDDSSLGLREFGFDDLAIGDRVNVRAYLDSGTVVATRLEREDSDDSVTLKAPVEAISRPSLTLLGVIATSDQDTICQNAQRDVIDADSFYSLVTIGGLVKVVGVYDGTSILADSMFLRECQDSCL